MSAIHREGRGGKLTIEVAGSEATTMELDHAIRALSLLVRWASRKAQSRGIPMELPDGNTVIDDMSKGYKSRKLAN